MANKLSIDPEKRKQLIDWLVDLSVNMTAEEIEEKTGVSVNDINSAKVAKGRPLGFEKFNAAYNRIQKFYEELALANPSESNNASKEYLYYYNSSRYEIAVAKMRFELKLDSSEWGNGTLEYLEISDNGYSIKWKFSMERIWPKRINKNSRVAFYSAKCDVPPMDEQVNFFTINIKNSTLEKRKFLFLTYSVLETDDKKPSAGVGLLVEEKDPSKKLNEVFINGIDPWIINTLRNKKHTLEGWISHVYSKIESIKGDYEKSIKPADIQSYCINSVSGFYKGYYLRNDIPGPEEGINDRGGVVCVIIHINKNGEVFIYYKLTEDSTIRKYRGFVVFPNDNKKFLKISLELEKTHRFYMFLKQIDSDGLEYAGTFSGWKKMYTPFSTAILMRKIRNQGLSDIKTLKLDDLRELLNTSFVGRIHKTSLELNKYSEADRIKEVKEIIKIFSDDNQFLGAYKECVELIEKCLPNSFEIEKPKP